MLPEQSQTLLLQEKSRLFWELFHTGSKSAAIFAWPTWSFDPAPAETNRRDPVVIGKEEKMDHHDYIVGCLKRAREAVGMPIAEVARRAGMSSASVERTFRGERTLKADELVWLCLVLHVNPQLLVPDGLVVKDGAITCVDVAMCGLGAAGRAKR